MDGAASSQATWDSKCISNDLLECRPTSVYCLGGLDACCMQIGDIRWSVAGQGEE